MARDGREAEVQALAARIDIADPGSILRFGQDAQNRATLAADAMLEGARNREAGEAGVTLSTLLGTLRGFDMRGLAEKPGFFARIFNKAGAETAKVVQRYETIKGQVEEVGDRLDSHRTRLLEDVEKLERLYRATLDWFHALGDHIAAGESVLRRVDEEAVPAMAREVENGDSVAAQRLRDLRSARDELERRVHDLRLTRQVAMQALPSIRLIQENDKALAAKIQSVIANTVPLWRQQLAQALAIQTMREAGRTLKEATDLTNDLLVGNAERLRQGNAEARVQLERGVFDIEAVKKANASLVATIEDSLRIAQDAQAQRASATKELEKAEAEIRRALLAARASGGSGSGARAG
ncbi:toxic anion resistance protein [Roseicella sp. DB1501]|nr:toxic anion resistance protein [Roseicella sp. DB1501]